MGSRVLSVVWSVLASLIGIPALQVAWLRVSLVVVCSMVSGLITSGEVEEPALIFLSPAGGEAEGDGVLASISSALADHSVQ